MRCFGTLSFCVLESSQCLRIRDRAAWTFSTELFFSVIKTSAFAKPHNSTPCTFLCRLSPCIICSVGTHPSVYFVLLLILCKAFSFAFLECFSEPAFKHSSARPLSLEIGSWARCQKAILNRRLKKP